MRANGTRNYKTRVNERKNCEYQRRHYLFQDKPRHYIGRFSRIDTQAAQKSLRLRIGLHSDWNFQELTQISHPAMLQL